MDYDVIIAGGGAAGLTAAAYTSRRGLSTILLEKQDALGGLIRSISRGGFTFDMGLRAVEDSGILLPMLSELGISMDYVKSKVSIGIEDRVIPIVTEDSLEDYRKLLESFYPESRKDIDDILKVIRRIMKDMEVLYGIENPLFKDLKHDYRYMFRTLLPWMGKFLFTIGKINRMQQPVEDFLRTLTSNESLRSIIGQHFFSCTPAFFAMSYFSVYLDYLYPKGGTGTLTRLLAEYGISQDAVMKTGRAVIKVDPVGRTVTDSTGESYGYRKLIWCCDLTTLYRYLDMQGITDSRLVSALENRRLQLEENRGGDSVFSLFLSVDENPEYFRNISEGHFFYTPESRGLGDIRTTELARLLSEYDSSRDGPGKVREFVKKYLAYTTYEISVPVLKDPSMAPEHKTGLIVSCLFSYDVLKRAESDGWYEELRDLCADCIVEVLSRSIYPGLSEKIMERFCSTPVTIETITGNSQGAITGWSFDTGQIPAVHEMQKVSRSVITPMNHVFQAGQWTYSPSGLPMAVLTGKLAADRVIRELR